MTTQVIREQSRHKFVYEVEPVGDGKQRITLVKHPIKKYREREGESVVTDRDPEKVCLALRKKKNGGGLCTRFKRNDRNRCRFCGGANPSGPDAANWEHGLTSKAARSLPGRLGEIAERFEGEDPLDSILDELKFVKTLRAFYTESREDHELILPGAIEDLSKIIDRIDRLASHYVKARNETALTGEEILVLRRQLSQLFGEFGAALPEGERDAFERRLAQIFGITEEAVKLLAEGEDGKR